MEHFRSPFAADDLTTSHAIDNRAFFDDMLARARRHRFFAHPFITTFADLAPTADAVSFVLTSFYKIVSPFTGLLCTLAGRAPDLRCRFALMDNIYEEMGCGDIDAAHPSLYLEMLSSIGVARWEAERASALPVIARINDNLTSTVEHRSFVVACALLASAEATIPPSFPAMSTLARRAFPDVDMGFFDRHGPRDEGHSDDAAVLFSVCADEADYALVDAAVELDLDLRAELFDEWMQALGSAVYARRSERPGRPSQRPPRAPSVRPGASRPSVPPPR